MLTDKLRAGAQGRVFKFLFWIIILSFIFAGVGNYLIPRLNTDPVEVGKYKISANEWNEQYNQRTQLLQRMYGSQAATLLENPQYVYNLRMQVLDSMIDNIALNSQTFENGIRIGDEQVKDVIRHDEHFFKDGKFDNDLFLASVRNMGSSPDYYAERLRTSLMTQTLVDPVLKASAIPLPYEVDTLSNLYAQVRTVDLYTLNPDSLKGNIKLSDDEVLKFYNEHNDLFMKPESATFTYVVLSVDELKKTVNATDDVCEEYYRLNQDEFTVPESRELSQILIKSSSDMKQKADEALKALKSGQDFITVGEKFSEAPDFAENHGSLGTVKRGTLSKSIDEVAFNLKAVGDISEIIYDDFGAHIIRLDGIVASHVPPFVEIKEEVKKRYVDTKAQSLYNDKSATLADISFENPDSLDQAAEACGIKVLEAKNVSAGDTTLVWPLNTQEIQRAAYNEDNRTSHINSNVINLGDSACAVINVSEYHEAVLQPFDKVKDKALSFAENAKLVSEANNILENYAKSLKADAKAVIPQNVVKKENVLVERASGVEMSDPTFSFAVYAIPANVGDYIVTLHKNIPALAVLKSIDLDKNNSIDLYANLIRTQLTNYKANSASLMLYKRARELSEINYNEDAIKMVNQQSSQD